MVNKIAGAVAAAVGTITLATSAEADSINTKGGLLTCAAASTQIRNIPNTAKGREEAIALLRKMAPQVKQGTGIDSSNPAAMDPQARTAAARYIAEGCTIGHGMKDVQPEPVMAPVWNSPEWKVTVGANVGGHNKEASNELVEATTEGFGLTTSLSAVASTKVRDGVWVGARVEGDFTRGTEMKDNYDRETEVDSNLFTVGPDVEFDLNDHGTSLNLSAGYATGSSTVDVKGGDTYKFDEKGWYALGQVNQAVTEDLSVNLGVKYYNLESKEKESGIKNDSDEVVVRAGATFTFGGDR